ncbi:MAG TPA: DMT family transporter [Candidatus Dojkabacteria bacterium]|jgi:drug/metabolite transporter (DMT)-like permease
MILLPIISSLLLALGNVALRKSFKNVTPAFTFTMIAIFSIITLIPVGFILGVEKDALLLSLFYGLLSAVLGQALYNYALSKGEMSITATLLSTFPVYTILFSYFINDERLTRIQILLVAVTIIGTMIISLTEKFDRSEFKNISYVFWPILSAVMVGLTDSLAKNFIDRSGSGTFLVGVAIMQLPVSLIFMRIMKEPLRRIVDSFRKINIYKFALLGGFFATLHIMTLFLSFEKFDASIAAPIIGGGAPLLTLVLSLIIFKDRISKKDYLGLFVTMAGIIGVSLAI